jgi:hypothetical protein
LERAGKWARRNPTVAMLTAAVASLLLGACVATVFRVVAWRNAALAEEKAADAERESIRAGKEAEKAKEATKKAIREAERADHEEKVAKVRPHGCQMTAAFHAWQQHDLMAAEALLEGVSATLQQTREYCHLRALCRRKGMPLEGHSRSVFAVAYSPDGKRILSGSSDRALKVWDAATGQHWLTLKGHTGTVRSVAFSPDGKRIVSGSSDRTLKIWDAETGQENITLKGHFPRVTRVAFSADGSRIVCGSADGTLKVWDAARQDLRSHWPDACRTETPPPGSKTNPASPCCPRQPGVPLG